MDDEIKCENAETVFTGSPMEPQEPVLFPCGDCESCKRALGESEQREELKREIGDAVEAVLKGRPPPWDSSTVSDIMRALEAVMPCRPNVNVSIAEPTEDDKAARVLRGVTITAPITRGMWKQMEKVEE